MNIIYNPPERQWPELLKRPSQKFEDIEVMVNRVFAAVKSDGDTAVAKYTSKFDGVSLQNTVCSSKEIKTATRQVNTELKEAIKMAKINIEKFHKAQKTKRVFVETANGVECWQEKRPIQKVGLYIPGGSAPLFSTILMLAIPAKLAGCGEIVLCTPPNKEGNIHPAILFTASLCGIQKIYKIGGIQAIAAMTFGTETISKVYKIFGPGNQYVTVAKQLATRYQVAIDMPAGPSEVLIVANESANPAFIASDLLSQAEHGPDSQVVFISTSKALIPQVEEELKKQLQELPRKDIASKAIENSSLIYLENPSKALQMINQYGPEHFIVCGKNTQFYVDGVQNAGSVFIGDYSPESAGDYASGTNHTLPTNGYAKQYSGVNLDSFMKTITFQQISAQGISNIGPAIELMAEAEGLHAHKNAVSLRLKELKSHE